MNTLEHVTKAETDAADSKTKDAFVKEYQANLPEFVKAATVLIDAQRFEDGISRRDIKELSEASNTTADQKAVLQILNNNFDLLDKMAVTRSNGLIGYTTDDNPLHKPKAEDDMITRADMLTFSAALSPEIAKGLEEHPGVDYTYAAPVVNGFWSFVAGNLALDMTGMAASACEGGMVLAGVVGGFWVAAGAAAAYTALEAYGAYRVINGDVTKEIESQVKSRSEMLKQWK